ILAQSNVTARALREYLRLVLPEWTRSDDQDEVSRIVWPSRRLGLEAYRSLSEELERETAAYEGMALNDVVIVVDHVNLKKLDPVALEGWNHTIAMLILTFPEFRWVFGAFEEQSSDEAKRLIKAHGLEALFGPARQMIFDPTGLRKWILSLAKRLDQ